MKKHHVYIAEPLPIFRALTFRQYAPMQMPMGNNSAVSTLEELLAVSDFVTLHVPLSDATTRMIGAAQLQHMRKGR